MMCLAKIDSDTAELILMFPRADAALEAHVDESSLSLFCTPAIIATLLAMTAASLLQRAGHRGLAVLTGGAGDWADATGQPLREGP